MSISVNGFAPVASPDVSDMRDSRAFDNQAAASFAGVFATAMQPKTPTPVAKQNDGNSELDRPESSEKTEEASSTKEDDETSTTKSSRKHAHHAHAATSSSDVVKSVDVLDPALQDKLARVVQRMKDETGVDVNVQETYRSQSRQNTLYAQGRETAGDIVTWTQHSQHTAGRAVDVALTADGKPVGADAYTTLQRIANEEGLHTLGARDPGHLELQSTTPSTRAAVDLTSLNPVEPADASGPGQVSIARVAQLARVADVAAVAQPAQVARVASVARPSSAAPTSSTTPTDSISASGGAKLNPGTTVGSLSSSQNSGGAQQRFGSNRDSRGQSGSGDARYSAMAAAVALRNQALGAGGGDGFSLAGASGITGTSAAERVAQVIDAMDNAPARSLSQITMSVDAGNGASDKIQLSMRGATLNATIDAADARAAQAMNGRADELVRALTKDGIDLQSLHVRSATNTAAAGGLAAATSPQTSSDSSNNSRFERGQSQQQDRDQQSRSRQDRRNQQREQRGGQNQ